MLHIELLSIGNELLLGDVLDTNSHWLCGQLTRQGGQVRRIAQVRDELLAIGGELQRCLEDGAGLVVTTGGLGPTDDDITLQAVAAALQRPLQEDAQALELIRERYRKLAAEGYTGDTSLTPSRRKMAQLPRGARPLYNPAGSAPGVLLQQERTTIACLPGVPREMKAIFEHSLSPLLEELFEGRVYAEWSVRLSGGGESSLVRLLRQVVQAHPQVYVKSRAQSYDPQQERWPRVLVTLSMNGSRRQEVEAALEACLQDLLRHLQEVPGVQIERVERPL